MPIANYLYIILLKSNRNVGNFKTGWGGSQMIISIMSKCHSLSDMMQINMGASNLSSAVSANLLLKSYKAYL